MAGQDSLLLESFSESESLCGFDHLGFDEPDCSDPLAMSGRCDRHEGIRIEISEHSHSMRQAANIIIALQKFKHHRKVQSTEFTNHELFNIFMENMVEECVVMGVSRNSSSTYNKQDKDIQCSVCDDLKKNLVRSQNAPILLAVTLKGGNISQRVSINLSAYTTPERPAAKGQPVCLGITQSNLYLACTEDSGAFHLTLEEVNDKETLKTIYKNNDMERFLFLRNVTGDSINTFESVKYPGWFISTSKDEYKPVDMCRAEDTSRQKVFSLQNQQVVWGSEWV